MNWEELAEQIYNDLQLGEDKEFVDAIKSCSAETFAYNAHFGLGMHIRNDYVFGNKKAKWIQGLLDDIIAPHPDEISHKILIELHRLDQKKKEK